MYRMGQNGTDNLHVETIILHKGKILLLSHFVHFVQAFMSFMISVIYHPVKSVKRPQLLQQKSFLKSLRLPRGCQSPVIWAAG